MGRRKKDTTLDQETAVLNAAHLLHILGLEANLPATGNGEVRPVPFQPKHIRYLVSEPGHDFRVEDAPAEWAQRVGLPGNEGIIDRFDEINEEALRPWDGESPFPNDAGREIVQERIKTLTQEGALKKVENGYLYVSGAFRTLKPPRTVKDIITEEDRPQLLNSEGLTASVGYGLPHDLSREQEDALEEAADLLHRARRIVTETVLEEPGHFVLSVWGCKPKIEREVEINGEKTTLRVAPPYP